MVVTEGGAAQDSEVRCIARTGGGEFVLLVRSHGGRLSQFRRWLRLTIHERPLTVPGVEQPVHLSTSFRSWSPESHRDLLWWLQDGYRWEARRELEKRLGHLEDLMAGAGHVLDDGAGLWQRLQRAEQAARMDPHGSGALSRVGLGEVLAAVRPPYAIAFVDLDHLRDFNAVAGSWITGDAALAALVRILRGVSRDAAVARYGGDEFYVVLPGLDGPAARECLQRALETCRADVRVGDLPVTFSAGVAAVEADAGPTGHAEAEAAALAAAHRLKATDRRGSVLLSVDRQAPGGR